MALVLDIGVQYDEFADALVLIDSQLPHFAEADDLRVLLVHKNTKRKLHARSRVGRAYWHANIGVWVRYSCGFAWSGAPPKSKRKRVYSGGGVKLLIAAEPIRAGWPVGVDESGRVVLSRTGIPVGVAVTDNEDDGTVPVLMPWSRVLPP